MASAIIHICVAKKVNEKLKMNENELILGSIAPDISKLIGQSKVKTHFLNSNNEDSIPDIKSFLSKYKDQLHKPFDMGYFIHLLTDKYWFRDYVYDFLNEYSLKTYGKLKTYTELKDIIYSDYSNINRKLIDYYNILLYLFCNDFSYPTTKIEEINVEELNILVDEMGLLIKTSKDLPTQIFKLDEIIDFIEVCSQKIIDILVANNFILLWEGVKCV